MRPNIPGPRSELRYGGQVKQAGNERTRILEGMSHLGFARGVSGPGRLNCASHWLFMRRARLCRDVSQLFPMISGHRRPAWKTYFLAWWL